MKGAEAMKLKLWNSKLFAGLAVVAGVAVMATSYGTAQEPPEDEIILRDGPGSPELQVKPLDVLKLKTIGAELAVDGVKKKIVAIQGGVPEKMHAIHEAATALSEAEGDDARSEAKEKLAKLLDEYFESDMERRERELSEVEERVNKLRSTLERRRQKKEDIIDLQIEVLLNEADGLGFFGGESMGMPGNPWEFKIHTFPGPKPPAAAIPVGPGAPGAPVAVPAPPQPARGPAYGGGFRMSGGERGYGIGGGGYRIGGDGGPRRRDPRMLDEQEGKMEEDQERGRNRERQRDRDRDEGDATPR
jgi:hypothetical protein